MSVITYKNILNQLKADLIGKDSHRGITLTYAWMANQFGHISLGFIPSFLVCHFFEFKTPILASFFVSVFWFSFELYNFLGPLLFKRVSYSKTVYLPKKNQYIFNPSWKNIAFDTFTDVCFFTFGAFLYSFLLTKNLAILLLLIALSVYLIFASKYWFLTKMHQHHANFPFQFRLSQWEFSISNDNKKKVNTFLKKTSTKGKHLLIFGSQLSGKTALGVGMLNELSIKHKSCLYTSAMKLYAYFFLEDDVNKKKIWNWKTTEYLIIDDVNPGNPIRKELIYPSEFLEFLDPTQVGKIHEESSNILSNKNVIWILGNCDKESLDDNDWIKMLLKIGVDKERISVINLQ